MSAWDKCIKLMEPLNGYLPAYGKADTVGGEMARAVNCLGYRYFNDGDKVGCFDLYDGYRNDIPSVTSAAAYLLDEYPDFGPQGSKIKTIVKTLVDSDCSNREYESLLIELCKAARAVFDKNPKVFEKRNTDDMFNHDYTAEKIKEQCYSVWVEDEDEYSDEDEDYNY